MGLLLSGVLDTAIADRWDQADLGSVVSGGLQADHGAKRTARPLATYEVQSNPVIERANSPDGDTLKQWETIRSRVRMSIHGTSRPTVATLAQTVADRYHNQHLEFTEGAVFHFCRVVDDFCLPTEHPDDEWEWVILLDVQWGRTTEKPLGG